VPIWQAPGALALASARHASGETLAALLHLVVGMIARNALALSCVALVVAMAALSAVIHVATQCADARVDSQVAVSATEPPTRNTSVVHIGADDLPRVYAELFAGSSCDNAQALALVGGGGEPTTVRRYPPTGPTEVVEIVRGDRRTLVVLE